MQLYYKVRILLISDQRLTFQNKIRRLFFLESPAFLFNKTINQKENRNESIRYADG